jgi:hypothetical protein
MGFGGFRLVHQFLSHEIRDVGMHKTISRVMWRTTLELRILKPEFKTKRVSEISGIKRAFQNIPENWDALQPCDRNHREIGKKENQERSCRWLKKLCSAEVGR